MDVLFGELGALYGAFAAGGGDPLPPLALQYADYAVWQRTWLSGAVQQEQADYWRGALQGAPALLTLPTDRARPAQQRYEGGLARATLGVELSRQLKALSQRHGVTLFMTLMAGWSALLARLAGQDEVVVGTPSANRGRAEVEGLIGFFVNTLAVRVDLADQPDVATLLARVKARTLAAQQHQDLPFEQVVEVLRPERSLAHSPLFQVMFTLQNAGQGRLTLPGLALLPSRMAEHVTAKFDLSLTVGDDGDALEVALEYADALFDAATARRYLDYWRALLAGMAADGAGPVAALPLLGEDERRRLLFDWNVTPAGAAADVCLHELFERQARRAPQAIALVHATQRLSYGELNERANRLARHLRALGVGPDVLVAICAGRGLDMMVALLAVLKAGGAYVPLDPAYPQQRLAYMLADCRPAALLTQGLPEGEWLATLRQAAPGVPLLDLADPAAPWASLDGGDLARADTGVAASSLAYLIYTSGSTGEPKGVMVEHANVVRLFASTDAWFGFGEGDVWTLFHSYAFDFSVWEIWGALLHGGRLVLVPQAVTRAPEEFYRLLCREQVTVLNQTPSAFRQLTAAQAGVAEAHRLRLVIFGGEALEPALLAPWYERNGTGATLVNMYGITETTVHVTYRPLAPADSARRDSPVGHRIPDLRIYILDRYGAPVPVGVAGELYVGGAGVARGYLRRPQLTAERFLPDPYAGVADARLYKTGDVGRWLADGSIAFVGRNDAQVKIRGFRIELGDIEAQLLRHAGVRDAVVLACDEAGGGQRLVAYCVAAPGQAPGAEDLRAHLAARLPEHMLPSAYLLLAALPLTPNGKLDRTALPTPGAEAYASRAYEAPRGEVETALAAIWSELLDLERIGRHDNFFELGGHSLLAIMLLDRMRRRQLHADVRSIFATPTLSQLAAATQEHLEIRL